MFDYTTTYLFDMQEIFDPERDGASVNRWIIIKGAIVRYVRTYRKCYRLQLENTNNGSS